MNVWDKLKSNSTLAAGTAWDFLFSQKTGTGSGQIKYIKTSEPPMATRIDFITDSIIYRGEAQPGSADSSSSWRITLTTLSADGDLIELWADGVSTYTKVWSNRLTYNYH